MKVLIDTNILISAVLNPKGTPFQAYMKAVTYPNHGMVCEQNIDELRRIYLKLLLVSLRTDGIIFLDGLYPSMEEELALVLDENKVTVQFSLHALEKVKLLERGQDGELITTKLPDMIGVGSEDASAQRVRAYRERKALEKKTEALQSNTGITAMKRGSNANVTEAKRVGNADKDIEIESDKEKDAERESDASVRGRAAVEKHVSEEPCGQTTYGTYKNVKLSEEEYESLKRLFPEDYQGKIDYLSSYMASTRSLPVGRQIMRLP